MPQQQTEETQLQLTGMDTLFPTNSAELLRTDETLRAIGYLTTGVAVRDSHERQQRALTRLLADEGVEGVFVVDSNDAGLFRRVNP